MQAYFNEQGVLVIDGFGTTINYDPSKIVLGDVQSLKKEFRNFVFTPKLEPVDRTIDRIRVKNRYQIKTMYPVQVTIAKRKDGWAYYDDEPGNVITTYTAKKLIATLVDAVNFAEANVDES